MILLYLPRFGLCFDTRAHLVPLNSLTDLQILLAAVCRPIIWLLHNAAATAMTSSEVMAAGIQLLELLAIPPRGPQLELLYG